MNQYATKSFVWTSAVKAKISLSSIVFLSALRPSEFELTGWFNGWKYIIWMKIPYIVLIHKLCSWCFWNNFLAFSKIRLDLNNVMFYVHKRLRVTGIIYRVSHTVWFESKYMMKKSWLHQIPLKSKTTKSTTKPLKHDFAISWLMILILHDFVRHISA